MAMRLLLASLLASLGYAAPPATCGGVKEFYRTNTCCGNPSKAVDLSCPYNFNKPTCALANVQAPRDLSTGATGLRVPKMATLNVAQSKMLPLANVHYHLGAEHKSDAYKSDVDSKAFDATQASGHRRLSSDPRPGYMCDETGLTAEEKTPYSFVYCKGTVTVGKSYEIHYVHSSAGYDADHLTADSDIDLMNDGLGGAANGRGMLNPMVVVQAQVFQIVNDNAAPTDADMLHGWSHKDNTPGATNSVMYPGSTTGTSHTNEICSPYGISWHVDKLCHKIAASSFDNLCKQMKDTYKLDGDLYPHGSRVIVDSKWVAPANYVLALA